MANQSNIIFKTTDPEGRSISLYKSTWEHIEERHPEITSTGEIESTIIQPNIITQNLLKDSIIYSTIGRTVSYFNVIAKIDDTYTEGFVITSYLSNNIPKGNTIWIRKS